MEFFVAFFIALIVGAIFAFGLGRSGPWPGILWFFVLLILGTWALGRWIQPVGPALGEVAWLPYLLAAVLIALLAAAASPGRPRTTLHSPEEESRAATAAVALGGFFWGLVLLFLIAIVAGFFW